MIKLHNGTPQNYKGLKKNKAVSMISKCLLCKKDNLKVILGLSSTPVADEYIPKERLGKKQDEYPLNLALCLDCGNVQLLDMINPDILYGKYKYITSKSPGLIAHFEKYAQQVIDYVNPPKESLVVDIGSNDGTLLSFFKKQDMRVLGIDPAKDLAQKTTTEGIETLPAYFTEELAGKIRKEKGPAAIITANNVIANVSNLSNIIDGIKILLDNKGVFVFETGYLLDMVRELVFDNIYHEHLCYYSVNSLKSFFTANSTQLIDVKGVSTKGGSIRGFVQLSNGMRKVSPSVSEFLGIENKLGIGSPEIFSDFSNTMEKIKVEIVSSLKNLKNQKKTIAGYCASHSVTTLLYYLDIAKYIDFIVDDNPIYQGLFSPGHHIPVLHPSELYSKKPDFVVILAWRFSKPIIEKHREYLDRGGHFIKIWPKLEII